MSLFLQAYRAVLLDGSLPSAAVSGALALWAVAALIIGTAMFRAVSAQIPEML